MVNPTLIFVWALFAVVVTGVAYLAFRSNAEAPEGTDWEEELGINEEATNLEAERHDEMDEETHPGFNEDAAGLEVDRGTGQDQEQEER